MNIIDRWFVYMNLRALPCKCGSRDLEFGRINSFGYDRIFINCKSCQFEAPSTVGSYCSAIEYWNKEHTKDKPQKPLPPVYVIKGEL